MMIIFHFLETFSAITITKIYKNKFFFLFLHIILQSFHFYELRFLKFYILCNFPIVFEYFILYETFIFPENSQNRSDILLQLILPPNKHTFTFLLHTNIFNHLRFFFNNLKLLINLWYLNVHQFSINKRINSRKKHHFNFYNFLYLIMYGDTIDWLINHILIIEEIFIYKNKEQQNVLNMQHTIYFMLSICALFFYQLINFGIIRNWVMSYFNVICSILGSIGYYFLLRD